LLDWIHDLCDGAGRPSVFPGLGNRRLAIRFRPPSRTSHSCRRFPPPPTPNHTRSNGDQGGRVVQCGLWKPAWWVSSRAAATAHWPAESCTLAPRNNNPKTHTSDLIFSLCKSFHKGERYVCVSLLAFITINHQQ
jgi:hypothetical protein